MSLDLANDTRRKFYSYKRPQPSGAVGQEGQTHTGQILAPPPPPTVWTPPIHIPNIQPPSEGFPERAGASEIFVLL